MGSTRMENRMWENWIVKPVAVLYFSSAGGQTELTARGNGIWHAVGQWMGWETSILRCAVLFLATLSSLHYLWCLTINRDGVHKRDKVNWVGPVFDPNYIPNQLGHTGQPNPLSTHIHHISPPQTHDPFFQSSNVFPQPKSAWPSPIFPLQGPAFLLCPLSCLSTKEL